MGKVTKRPRQPRREAFVTKSLSTKMAITIALVFMAFLAIFVAWVATTLRSDLFSSRRDLVLEDASVRFGQMQAALERSTASTPDQVQEVVTQSLNSISESAAGAGAVGVMLLRSAEAEPAFRINEYISADHQHLITQQFRDSLSLEEGTWQSVALEQGGQKSPGILVGALVEIPLAGVYEMVVVYSLAFEQQTLSTVLRVLAMGALPVLLVMGTFTFYLVYRQMRPVRAAADAASALAGGDLNQRLKVEGNDETARLSSAFNDMAESLQQKINDYDALAQLQQRFVSDVSHELRTPMTTIRMADEMIYQDRADLPPAAKRSAELLHSEVQRFEEMLADLLEISRYDAQSAKLEGEATDMYALVEKVVESNGELAERLGVEVKVGKRPKKASVPVDPIRLERVVRNLVVNACEYAEGKPVEVTVAAGKEAVAIRVRDRGVGMSPDVVRRVFDRFYRANPSRTRTTGGTGLGLAIAKEDVALHGGVINAWGEPGKGSSFVVTLPRKPRGIVTEFPLVVWEDDS